MSFKYRIKSSCLESRAARLYKLPGAKESPTESNGFTIIELMIATLIFSVVLMLITVGVIRFNQAYYKGVTQSETQNVARSIIENISQAIQFSGGAVTYPIGTTNGSQGFCIGDQRYSYLLGWELAGSLNASQHQSAHALVVDSSGSCSGMSAQDLRASPAGKELLGPSMRISKLTVSPVSGSSNLYSIDVRVVYGDDVVLVSPSGTSPAATAPDATCSTQDFTQFCAVSELSTIVQKRIN